MMTLDTMCGAVRKVKWSGVFSEVLNMYAGDGPVLSECPLHIEFEDEMGVDQGGVTRDLFSAFWEECYTLMFDGSSILVPILCPQTDTSTLRLLGSIVSHAYLVSGFLQVRIALPCVIGILCGSGASIPESVLCEAFLDYISFTERALFKEALKVNVSAFSPEVQESLLNTLSRYGCRNMPTPSNLSASLLQVAKFEFCSKPAAAIILMHSGVPSDHAKFWSSVQSVEGVCSIYRMLTVSPKKVLGILKLPLLVNPAEERIGGYLIDMIGNMSTNLLQRFLRFTTGSSVLSVSCIIVQFNRLSGLARRPCAHTCDALLELPISYANYSDFHGEWMAILNDNDLCWVMNCL